MSSRDLLQGDCGPVPSRDEGEKTIPRVEHIENALGATFTAVLSRRMQSPVRETDIDEHNLRDDVPKSHR